MKIDKMFKSIRNDELSHQERLFRPLSAVGLAGILIAIVAGIISGENIENLLVMVGVFVLLTALTCYSVFKNKVKFGGCAIAAVIIYVILPLNFLTGGGVYGGAPLWFLFGVVYVCLMVDGKTKYVFFASCLILCGVCYYVAYFHPELVAHHEESLVYLDSLATLIIVSTLTCCMVLLQNRIFHWENELAQKQKKEIEELNRTQNSFFSSMSHEIRTPINTIIGLNEMILREDVSDEVAEDAKNIQSASKMLLALINDILDMSKIQSGRMDIVSTAYNVGDMLSDIVNMIWIRAKAKGLEFHIDVDQTMPALLLGDEVRIKQVLINVLNNAVKYTEEGSVTLSIQCQKIENGSAQIVYSIADTGMGIKKENIPHLFNAFRRVDEEKNRYIEGTGLGLSIVKQLVTLMGGEVAVNSVYTKGSTFVITLPQKIVDTGVLGELNLEARHAINERKHYKQSFEAPKARLLVVDDNETNLLVVEKLLRETKIQIETVTSGALCLQRTVKNRYDMIFMDHLMPEMDGVECLHAIRSQVGGLNQETPIVILTANAGGDNQAMYRREGFDGYLLKPVNGNQLEMELLKHLPRDLVNIVGDVDSVGVVESAIRTHKKNLPIMITIDSVGDLPKELVEKYKIAVMPNLLFTEGGEFLDGVETDIDGILSYMNDKNRVIRSDAQSSAEYEKFFAEQLTKAHHVIHICIPSSLSKSYENAKEAAKIFDNVDVVNSRHLSSGMGLLALHAVECVEKGYSPEAVIKEIKQFRKRIRTSFVTDSTEFLMRNGRISDKVSALCTTLMLHPVLVMKKKKLMVGPIWMGTRNSIWKKYVSSTLGNGKDINKDILFVTYVGLNAKELEEIDELVKQRVNFKNIIHQKASSAISINAGPGTFGLIFHMEK